MSNIAVEWNIYQKLQEVRRKMYETPLKKTGFNKHLSFSYFELADFLPTATKLFAEQGLCPIFSIYTDQNGIEVAQLKLCSGPEQIVFVIPTAEANNSSNPIQNQGSKVTYLRRYLYLICLDLTENDAIDADEALKEKKVEDKKATPKQVEMLRSLYNEENVAKMLEYYNIQNLDELSLKTASELIARKKNGTH